MSVEIICGDARRRRHHGNGRSSTLMQQNHKQRRISELMAQVQPLMEELAHLEPPDVLTLVLALPVDLAGYMSELAQRKGVDLPHIYSSACLEGLFHFARENGEDKEARQIARMIRRISDEQTWATFCERHRDVECEGRG